MADSFADSYSDPYSDVDNNTSQDKAFRDMLGQIQARYTTVSAAPNVQQPMPTGSGSDSTAQALKDAIASLAGSLGGQQQQMIMQQPTQQPQQAAQQPATPQTASQPQAPSGPVYGSREYYYSQHPPPKPQQDQAQGPAGYNIIGSADPHSIMGGVGSSMPSGGSW